MRGQNRASVVLFALQGVALGVGIMGLSAVFASETIDAVKDAGELKVCMAEAPPLSRLDPATSEWSGFNVDLARDLASVMGVELNIVDQTYSTIVPSLMSGHCEIIMAPLFANLERAQVVAFTDFYSSSGIQVVVPEDSQFTQWEELNSEEVTIAVLSGTQDEAVAMETFPDATMKGVVSETTPAIFLEVAAGRADATMTDISTIQEFMKQNPQAELVVLEPNRVAKPTGRAFAIRPGDPHFLNFLNIWLESRRDRFEQIEGL